jgi:thiamine transporter ThiT
LFTPVGLIALLCNLLGISGQNTAAISLAAIVLTAIILYRGAINRAVPSAVVCGLLVGLISVFAANYEHILFKDTGLVHYFHASNDFLGQAGPFFKRAHHEIWFVGLDFHITAGDRKKLILQKLGEGVKVRFLVFNPDSPFLPNIAQDFDQSPQELSAECIKSIDSIVALRKEWLQQPAAQEYPEGLEVKLFEDVPHARFYIVDPDDTRARSFYIPYMNRENSPVLPGYLLNNIDGGVIQDYLPGIRKLWNSAQPVELYENRHAVPN